MESPTEAMAKLRQEAHVTADAEPAACFPCSIAPGKGHGAGPYDGGNGKGGSTLSLSRRGPEWKGICLLSLCKEPLLPLRAMT